MHRFISELLLLFLCQYHTVLISVGLLYTLKSGSLIPPTSFFFLNIPLTIQGLLCFRINRKLFLGPSFVKSAMDDLIGIALNLCIGLGDMFILMILILPVQEHGISFCVNDIDSSCPRTWYIFLR